MVVCVLVLGLVLVCLLDIFIIILTTTTTSTTTTTTTGMSVLTTCFAAHDSLRQRMGRAGKCVVV